MLQIRKRAWLLLLLSVKGSPIIVILPRLVAVMLVAGVVTYFHETDGMFETGLTTTPFTLIALPLGIFLGFRNNTSYDRFWEGRKLWGRLVNTSRSLTRQILTLIGPMPGQAAPDDLPAVQRELVHRVVGYVHAFRHHLRNEATIPDAAPFLPADEVARLENESNVPAAILQRLGDRFRDQWQRGLVHDLHLPVLEASLTELMDIQGGCERIRSTPIPASYTLLIHRLVATYVFALPFGLVGSVGAFTPIVVLLVGYAFLGLDAIGDQIEEPFGHDINDLPLSTLSRMIEVNLRQRLGDPDMPPLLGPRDGVLD